MYDINIKNVKKGKKFFYTFFLAGLFFLILLGSIYISSIVKLESLDSSVKSTNVEVEAYTDTEGDTMYSLVYSYVVDGKNYMCKSFFSSILNPGNSNKTIYYDSNNPSSCMTEYSKFASNIILLYMVIPIIFIVVAVVNIMKIRKRVRIILELNQKGKLIKNLPYRLENSGAKVNEVPIQRPVVDYVLPTGVNITLYGDARHDRKTYDQDGMVDLLIDESNPENYFIDFEINRINGNLSSDYSKSNSSSNAMNNKAVYSQSTTQNYYNQASDNHKIKY